MTGFQTYALAAELLDLVFGASPGVSRSTLYFALFTQSPSAGGLGGGQEVLGGSYARVPISNNLTNFPAATTGSKVLTIPVTWPKATGAWGTVEAIGVFDSLNGGMLMFYVPVAPKVVDIDDTVFLQASTFYINATEESPRAILTSTGEVIVDSLDRTLVTS